MSPRKIIIDTDPGQDDAAAIMLALASPELQILGITAVAGNVPLALTARNARIILDICGRTEIPVYAGAKAPLKRELVTAEYVHGKSGIDGVEPYEPATPLQSAHAVDFIVETLQAAEDGEITLCPLGPLTNVALALQRAPEIKPKIREIVLMGGGFFEGGNVTPAAEFNIYVDPEAAAIVFASGVAITTSRTRVARLRESKRKPAQSMADMLDFFERFDEKKYGTDGGPLHDPTVIAYVIRPDLFSGRQCNVEIETTSELTLGMTVVDWWHVTDRARNANVIRDMDVDGFFDLFIERVSRL